MNQTNPNLGPASDKHERLLSLLADKSLGQLDPADEAELRQLLPEFPQIDPETVVRQFELVAAQVDLASLQIQEMPDSVRSRIRQAAPIAQGPIRIAGDSSQPSQPLKPVQSDSLRFPAWIRVAAAILAAALIFYAGMYTGRTPTPVVQVVPPPPPTPTPAQLRSALLAGTSDVVTVAWTATGDESGPAASGDVVWSTSKQVGYMRIHGLAKNDPRIKQYQLWIFDINQDAAAPIDGGVFDIDDSTGDVIVPIHAKLNVVQPTMFAITIEKPGGVVVSKREHLPLIAKVAKA